MDKVAENRAVLFFDFSPFLNALVERSREAYPFFPVSELYALAWWEIASDYFVSFQLCIWLKPQFSQHRTSHKKKPHKLDF